jgi:XTP/dITP diphosphohydrolase
MVRFLSRNTYKIREATRILTSFGIDLMPLHAEVEELQTLDTLRLVRDKALKAFQLVGRPLFVEHTGLYLDLLNGFPGGLTQIFWDTLQKDRFAELFGSDTARVTARTHIGYVDGRRLWHFEGEVTGRIVGPPRVDHGFQWDCVFVPDGHTETFSEMGDRKDEISMRRRALEKLAGHIAREHGAH